MYQLTHNDTFQLLSKNFSQIWMIFNFLNFSLKQYSKLFIMISFNCYFLLWFRT